MLFIITVLLPLANAFRSRQVTSTSAVDPDGGWLNGQTCNGYIFQNLTYLDSGFQADVFLADKYVVKVAKGSGTSVEEQFHRECKILHILKAVEHVIHCLAHCTLNGRPVLILSRAHGTSFKKSAIQGTPEFQQRAVTMMLLIGLAVLNKGIVNTDQQPNIMFDSDGTPTFIDFGAAVELNTKAGGFRDFYVDAYLRELFFLVPPSLVPLADRVLSRFVGPDANRVSEVWAVARTKKLASRKESGEYDNQQSGSNTISHATVPNLVQPGSNTSSLAIEPNVVQLVGLCPTNPCIGLANAVAGCLAGSPLDLVYVRCCMEKSQGGHEQLKTAALRTTCQGLGPVQKQESIGLAHSHGTSEAKKLNKPAHDLVIASPIQATGSVRRVNNDLMQCPKVPCTGVPHGDIAECLTTSFELVYARCCHGQGVRGSKEAAIAKACD